MMKLWPKLCPILYAKGIDVDYSTLVRIVSLIKERAFLFLNLGFGDYFFVAPSSYDEKAAKNWKEDTPALMQRVIEMLSHKRFHFGQCRNHFKGLDGAK
jgi:glutamyl-tRNA synthetase